MSNTGGATSQGRCVQCSVIYYLSVPSTYYYECYVVVVGWAHVCFPTYVPGRLVIATSRHATSTAPTPASKSHAVWPVTACMRQPPGPRPRSPGCQPAIRPLTSHNFPSSPPTLQPSNSLPAFFRIPVASRLSHCTLALHRQPFPGSPCLHNSADLDKVRLTHTCPALAGCDSCDSCDTTGPCRRMLAPCLSPCALLHSVLALRPASAPRARLRRSLRQSLRQADGLPHGSCDRDTRCDLTGAIHWSVAKEPPLSSNFCSRRLGSAIPPASTDIDTCSGECGVRIPTLPVRQT